MFVAFLKKCKFFVFFSVDLKDFSLKKDKEKKSLQKRKKEQKKSCYENRRRRKTTKKRGKSQRKLKEKN